MPTTIAPYFLKNDTGPRWAAGGFLFKPLIEEAQSGGKFSIVRVEGAKNVAQPLFQAQRPKFDNVYHAIFVTEGTFCISIDDAEVALHAGDTVFIPAGSHFAFNVTSLYGIGYLFSNAGGLAQKLAPFGEDYPSTIISENFPAGASYRE